MRRIVERDLKDAAITALSDDRRFATAYNAALQSGKMALACAGYRVVGAAHHQTTFEALTLALGNSIQNLAAYFETCRRKRNAVDYDMASVVSATEADEIIVQAAELARLVEEWIGRRYPSLKR